MKSIPVFYSPRLVANAHSFSPSAGKPALAVESWKELGIPIDIREPVPATEEDFCLAHGRNYVQRVLACHANNGFNNRLPEVAASLPYTTGAFIGAAREAVNNGCVAVAPVSGFHHASHDQGGGYCTFNGLVVAAQVLKREGLVKKVGILDFDQHYGDGTADIIRARQLGDWLSQYCAASEYRLHDQAGDFLKRVPALVERFVDCDLILYQAGADPHVADPLGGWLTTSQLAERDYKVFETAKTWGIPIAWNLAGGYQENFRLVLNIHDNTLKACWLAYGDTIKREPYVMNDTFYQVLAELLKSPEIRSVAYRYGEDIRTFKMICDEQLRRVCLSGKKPNEALEINVLTNTLCNSEEQGCEVTYWDEGLGYGDLFIDQTNGSGCSVKELVENYNRRAKYYLTRIDFGDIRGYQVEKREGAFLYKWVLDPNRKSRLEGVAE